MDLKIFVIFLVAVLVNTEKVSYEGYKLYKVVPKTEEQVTSLQDIKDEGLGEFWQDHFVVNNDVRIMVSKENEQEFVFRAKLSSLEAKLVIENLQRPQFNIGDEFLPTVACYNINPARYIVGATGLEGTETFRSAGGGEQFNLLLYKTADVSQTAGRAIDDQLKPATLNSKDSTSFHSLTWNSYHTLEEIYAWLDELIEAYPDIVTPAEMGSSFEGRPIRGIILNFQPDNSNPNVAIIESTIHAREWITPATVTWIIKEFLTSSDPEIRRLADNFEWHIFPVTNPDGYAYTFTTHRMWRKNRNTAYFTSCNASGVADDMSNGVDLNRNFDFAWNSVGTSPDPCSNTYPGPTANSEPETRAIVQYVLNINQRHNLVYYLAFHSYTQLVVIPFSNISGFEVVAATNYADMYEIAIRSADKLRQRFGTEFSVGVAADILYPMSGTSFDWVKLATDVPISYLLELRDLGEYGFLLPPSQIIPVGLEMMDFLVEMNKQAGILGYYDTSSASAVTSFGATVFGLALMMKNILLQ